MTLIVKTFVCLANSRKLTGRCIAGREVTDNWPGPWIRPVSDRPHEEVSEYERQYENGTDPRVLDVIRTTLVRSKPNDVQPENWLIHPGYYWEKIRTFPYSDLSNIADAPRNLWNIGSSTYHGCNDQLTLDQAKTLGESLRLIKLKEMTISVFAPSEAFGNSKRRVQAQFLYLGQRYGLWVTDPIYERKYLGKGDGYYRIGPCYATISIGEPFNGACYKLVAAIIEPSQ